MADIPSTRASLLVRLRDRLDESAWNEFVRLYAPLVYWFARRRGLQDADAADLTQEVLKSVSGSVGAFDPTQGSFRAWLFTVAHRRLYDHVQKTQRQPIGAGDAGTVQLLNDLPASDDQAFWDREYERQLFTLAAERIRSTFTETTWQAFRQTAVDGKSGTEVAQALGISVAAVYLAKSRVMAKLKEEVARLNSE